MDSAIWPAIPLAAWKDTCDTLHLWTQIVGKTRLKLSPKLNHWWASALYVSSRGLTTSAIPYGDRQFEIEFDFIEHALLIRTDTGEERAMALAPRTVADFYSEFQDLLRSLQIDVKISTLPNEVPNPIRFGEDRVHASYDRDSAHRYWRALLQADRLMKVFRAGFIGKASPVHFFWGSFDLACTRFSGKIAPSRPGADSITREAYSHEVYSCGFWPGSGPVQEAAFYAYAAPEPAGYPSSRVLPLEASYNNGTKGFILPYDVVRASSDPDRLVLDFFRTTYDAAADLGHWDRATLDKAA